MKYNYLYSHTQIVLNSQLTLIKASDLKMTFKYTHKFALLYKAFKMTESWAIGLPTLLQSVDWSASI